MKNILLINLGLFIICVGVIFALQNKKIYNIVENKGVSNMTDKKVLVAYFSFFNALDHILSFVATEGKEPRDEV